MSSKSDKKKNEDVTIEDVADVAEEEHIEEQPRDLERTVAELEDQYKRAVADYRNLEKRVAEERFEFIKFANKELLERLLPAFDTLFLAEKYVQDDGLKLTIKTLGDALEQVGVVRVQTVGKDFDPATMECIETVDGDENKVIEEVRPGFVLAGKTLRVAMVKVGSAKQNEKN